MKKNIILGCALIMLISVLTSCLKNAAIPNFNTTTVTFANSGPKFVTSDITVNPKDSIQFNYTVDCPTPMKIVYLMKNGNVVSTDTFKTGNVVHFNGIKKLIADSAAGPFTYTVVARDYAGVFLGTSTGITVTTAPDFIYYTNKTFAVPDTTDKTNKTYFNLDSETSYSYTDIKTGNNSNVIDIGYFYDPTIASGTTPKGHTIYNLALSPLPSALSIYDISTFTKNVTQLKLFTAVTWANINSGLLLKAQGIATFKTPQPNSVSSLASNSVVLFKIAAGKYGALLVTYVNQGSPYKSTYMNFEVKIQK